jgi:hypothetical protein
LKVPSELLKEETRKISTGIMAQVSSATVRLIIEIAVEAV